jgi:hypothetical protein
MDGDTQWPLASLRRHHASLSERKSADESNAELRAEPDDTERESGDASSGVSPLVVQLRKAVDILMRVHPMCAQVAHRQIQRTVTDNIDEVGAGAAVQKQGDILAVVPRSLEKLHVVQRMLDEALKIVEAVGEDALVEITLRQHDAAIRAREQAEARIKEQEQQLAGVRCDIIELERSLSRSQRIHSRLAINGSAQRLEEFERQRTNVEGVHGYLTSDLHTITESLAAQLKTNAAIHKKTHEIQHACEVAMEENTRANQLLGSGETLEVYRKARERDRIAADAELAEARDECEVEMARLGEGWVQTQARIMAEMLELQNEVRSVQERLDEQRQEADRNLAKQSAQWKKSVEDLDKVIADDAKALEDLRMEKVAALHREVLQSRQREQEVAASTQERLKVQLDEVKLQYKARLRMEEEKFGHMIRSDRRAVEVAKHKAKLLEKRASCIRESYRGHAIKSGCYVSSLDSEHTKYSKDSRRELSDCWV